MMEVFEFTFKSWYNLIINYQLHFPEPIGTITVFNIWAFFFVAFTLAMLINNITTRRGDDT